MAISINGSMINLDLDTILIWCLVGLVAGFLASRVALGHGVGLFGDIIVGIIGAFIGGFLASGFPINVQGVGPPILSEVGVAVAGAGVLLLGVGLVAGGGGPRPCQAGGNAWAASTTFPPAGRAGGGGGPRRSPIEWSSRSRQTTASRSRASARTRATLRPRWSSTS